MESTRSNIRARWAAIGAAVAVTLGAGAGVGWVAATSSPPSAFVSITPARILDNRPGNDIGLAGPFVSADGRDLQVTGTVPTTDGPAEVVPPGATAVTLNVTAVQPTAAGFISVRPAGTPGRPQTSNLNFEAGEITPNAVTVALSPTGALEITYDAFGTVGPTTEVLVDVLGYFVDGGSGTQGPTGPAGPPGPAGQDAPRPDVVHVPTSAFVPRFETEQYTRFFDGRMSTSAVSQCFFAPAPLPIGATIEAVTLHAVFTVGVADEVSASLRGRPYSTGGSEQIVALIQHSTTSPNLQNIRTTDIEALATVADGLTYYAETCLSPNITLQGLTVELSYD